MYIYIYILKLFPDSYYYIDIRKLLKYDKFYDK